MNDNFNISSTPTNLKIDEEWILLGRIIPPSCTKGNGCQLYLQAQKKGWSIEHFHTGRSTIPAEMGVELVTSILLPAQDMLVCCSFDPEERASDIDYLSMIKLAQPEDTIGFMTTNGLVFLVQIQGLNSMFGKSERCKHCYDFTALSLTGFDGNLDELMMVTKDERNH